MSVGRAFIDFGLGGEGDGLAFAHPGQLLTAWRIEAVAEVLRAAQEAALAGNWVIGMVAYEAAPAFDPAFEVAAPMADFPLAWFAVYAASTPGMLVPTQAPPKLAQPWQADIDFERFAEDIRAIHDDIRAGRYYQNNHTTRLRNRFPTPAGAAAEDAAWNAFCALASTQPSRYRLFVDGGGWQLLSVSPELFFDWTADGRLTTRPMKGTAPRSDDALTDAQAAAALRASPKERAENLMIVDLLRNDLSRIAELGSVAVHELFAIEALPSVWQMTSTVGCQTRPGLDLADVFGALFPCGSITGAPKVTAMQAIRERENSPRGPYCGALGVIRPGGHATFSVGIRSVLLRDRGDFREAECGVGSGITIGASAVGEYEEWQAKQRFLQRAWAGFELLETLRLQDGRYFLLAGHLARMARSAEHFGFRCDLDAARACLAEEAGRHPQGRYRVRLLLDGCGKFMVQTLPWQGLPGSRRVNLADLPMPGSNRLLQHKTSARQPYEKHVPRPGCLDVLLYNERGELTEFTRANLFLDIGGRRLTPASSCGVLPGVMREHLLRQGYLQEAVLGIDDLEKADALWWFNSVRGMLQVSLS